MVDTEQRLAYFAVSKDSEGSLAGGLLLVNSLGRPTEFHCTAPVAANRAQQILYGQTLESYLIADHICATLAQKLSQPPSFLLVEAFSALGVRSHVAYPVVLATPANIDDPNSQRTPSDDDASSFASTRLQVRVGGQEIYQEICLQALSAATADARQLQQWLATSALEFDLLEPFERIHLALAEARKAA